MKKLIAFFGILMAISAIAQDLQPFTIKGDIRNLKYYPPETMYLSYKSNGENVKDSARVSNRRFVFKGKISQPCEVYISYYYKLDDEGIKKIKSGSISGSKIMDENTLVSLFIDPCTMHFVSGDTLTRNRLKGGVNNPAYQQLMLQQKKFFNELNKSYAKFNFVSKDPKDTAGYAAVRKGNQEVAKKFKKNLYSGFILKNPSSPLNFFAIKSLMSSDPAFLADSVEYYYNLLPVQSQQTFEGQALKRMLQTGIGRMAPDFSQADTSGNMVSLSSLRGKYVLIDFWGSWCGWCRLESPYLVKNFNKYKDKGFTIISVATDTKREDWIKAIRKDGIGLWTHVSDLKGKGNSVAILYSVPYYPSNFLIDPTGKIIASNLRDNPQVQGVRLTDKLKEIFGE